MMKILAFAVTAFLGISAAHAAPLICRSFAPTGPDSAPENITVEIEKSPTQRKPWTPVAVTVTSDIAFAPLLDAAEGRLTGELDSDFRVDFAGGWIEVQVGNSGITGLNPNLAGTLNWDTGGTVYIVCPL